MPSYLEDFHVGQVERFGAYPVTRDEVLDFAGRFDPQPFHLDDDAAAASAIFGRLSASGWHTAAMTMRMLVDHNQALDRQTLGSPGIDEIRWLRPVYPGDTLRVETEVIEVRPSASRPTMGIVRLRLTTYNQQGEPVMRQVGANFQPRRPAAA
ncbi:MAG: hypothetical protein JWN59_553 [Sphingomonas bacterium]|nr:hypothetical protein [Sphingomonas bacterium]MDB5684984.1 hypothetical protein [Sphingomonas bacterium]